MKREGMVNSTWVVIWLLSYVVMSFLLAACAPEVNPTITPDGVESQETPVEVPLISVQVFPGEQEKRQLTVEEIPLDNCKGVEALSSAVERSHAVFHVAEIGTSTELNVEGELGVPGVGSVSVGSAIAQHYNTSYGEEDTVSRSVSVSAKEGTNMLHTVEQFELWETGAVAVFVGGEEVKREPYSFRKDFGVQVVDIVNVGDCEGTPTPMAGAGEEVVAEVPPTYTPYPTLTPYPTFTPLPIDTVTPQPTPTNAEFVVPASVLEVGEWWDENNVGIKLKSIDIKTYGIIYIELEISNNTGQNLIFQWSESRNLKLYDNTNFRYSHTNNNSGGNENIESGEIIHLKTQGSKYTSIWEADRIFEEGVTDLYFTVSGLANTSEATWHIPIK